MFRLATLPILAGTLVDTASAAQLAWSPDGERLAYVTVTAVDPPPVWSLPATRGLPTAAAPPVRPDLPTAVTAPVKLERQLRMCAADGSDDRLIFASPEPLGGVAFSPAGDTLAAVVGLPATGGVGTWEVLFWNRPGPPAMRFRPQPPSSAAIDAAGCTIAWHPQDERPAVSVLGRLLLLERAADGWKTRLEVPGSYPSWSPGGTELAWFRRQADGSRRLMWGPPGSDRAESTPLLTRAVSSPVRWIGPDLVVGLRESAVPEPEAGGQIELVTLDRLGRLDPVFGRRPSPGLPRPRIEIEDEPVLDYPLPRPRGPVGLRPTPRLEGAWLSLLQGSSKVLLQVRQSGGPHRLLLVDRKEDSRPRSWHPLDPLVPLGEFAHHPARNRTAGLVEGPFGTSALWLAADLSQHPSFPATDPAGRIARADLAAAVLLELLRSPPDARILNWPAGRPSRLLWCGLPTAHLWEPARFEPTVEGRVQLERVRSLVRIGRDALAEVRPEGLSAAQRLRIADLELLFAWLDDERHLPAAIDRRLDLATRWEERFELHLLHAGRLLRAGKTASGRHALADLAAELPDRPAPEPQSPAAAVWSVRIRTLLERPGEFFPETSDRD